MKLDTIANVSASHASSMPPQAPTAPASILARLRSPHVRGIVTRQIFLQLFLLFMTVIVLFPVLWIISMAIDPRGVTRPTDLNLFPANANLDAFEKLLTEPFLNVIPLNFSEMLVNSLFLALGTSLFTVVLGSSAAYAFSRFKFIGRQTGMLGFIILLMLPTTGVIIPLFILFSSIQVNSALAAAPPAFFTGALAATPPMIIFILARQYGKKDPDRLLNPPPGAIAAAVAGLTLIGISLTFYLMLVQNPSYDRIIRDPLKAIELEFQEAQDEFSQRTASVAQRETTAERREARAEFAALERDAMIELRESAKPAQATSLGRHLMI